MQQYNQGLIFDIKGSMAHFRKFYTNATSLTYYFPPRNTIMGMIASILGYERDSYYDDLSRERIGISVAVKTPPRKLLLSSNYLNTDDISWQKLRGEGQVPTKIEYVLPMPEDNKTMYKMQELSYRIFVCEYKGNILDRLEDAIKHSIYVYPLSLGTAYCLATAEFVDRCDFVKVDDKEVEISTVIPVEKIENIEKISSLHNTRIMREDKLPPDLINGRKPKGESRNYIFEATGKPIRVTLNESSDIFKTRIEKENKEIYGIFM